MTASEFSVSNLWMKMGLSSETWLVSPRQDLLFHQMLGLDRLWPHRFPSHFMTDWDYRENREVDQVSGAFFLVRRKVFEELNGFDERFFMYFEDLDFAYRAKQAGWRSFYLADAQAVHFGGGASYQVKGKRLYYVLNSRALYVAKHFGCSIQPGDNFGVLCSGILGTLQAGALPYDQGLILSKPSRHIECFLRTSPPIAEGLRGK